MKTRHIIESKTPEWHQARLGKFTASKVFLLMQDGRKDTFSASALTYIKEKAVEIISDAQPNEVSSASLSWGNTFEEMALTETGIEWKSNICYGYKDFVFGTPDGETDEAIVEVKCPYVSANHVENLLIVTEEELRENKPEYYWQIQLNLFLSEKKYAWFVSFDPRMKDKMRLKMLMVTPNQRDIEHLMIRIELANERRQEYLERIAQVIA